MEAQELERPPADASATPGEDRLDALRELLHDGRYAEAESAARELLAREEAEKGEDSVEVARVLDQIGRAHV